eukprot:3954509-Amphidinium_carterae.1
MLKGDPVQMAEYNALASRKAKQEFKRKWGETELAASSRKTQKITDHSQIQAKGKKGKWKTPYWISTQDGEAGAKSY